jgi:hypothetical protein
LPGKVLETAAIGAVTGSGSLTAQRAEWFLFTVDYESESVVFSFDTFKNENVRVGQQGL